jgi:hypothetical protein
MTHLTLMDGDDSDVPQTAWSEAVGDPVYGGPRTRT